MYHDIGISNLLLALIQRATRPVAASIFAVTLGALAGAGSSPVSGQASYNNFLKIGCYYNKADKKIWLAMSAVNPKYYSSNFEYSDKLLINIEAGDKRFKFSHEDIIVTPIGEFDFKGADKYKFMKYSLIVDYSASISTEHLRDVLLNLDEFIKDLPLAVEGQVIRFSDTVEASPFTNDKDEIRRELAKFPTRGGTALQDALMTAISELNQKGSDVPVKMIVIFTDGHDTASEDYKDRDSFINSFANTAKGHKIAVLVIGVTSDVDADLLRQVTDAAAGINGQFLHVPNFSQFKGAIDKVKKVIEDTIIFRIPKVGPDTGQVKIYLGEETDSGSFRTIQPVVCNFN